MQTLTTSLARLKNSLELGSLGSVLKNTDLISQRTYEMLEKAADDVGNSTFFFFFFLCVFLD